jgi:hypothetical protein
MKAAQVVLVVLVREMWSLSIQNRRMAMEEPQLCFVVRAQKDWE